VNIFEKRIEKKNKYLSLCEEFFDLRGNINYLVNTYGDEERGKVRYCFPNRCVRVGINVLGKFDNGKNTWQNMSNDEGEWAAVYT